MRLETVSYSNSPERITVEAFDCIWIAIKSPRASGPFTNKSLQWLDWKLQGQISRALIEGTSPSARPTFLATMKRIASPYLALDLGPTPTPEALLRSCEGLKCRRVLCLFEEEEKWAEFKRSLEKAAPEGQYPETVILGAELPQEVDC